MTSQRENQNQFYVHICFRFTLAGSGQYEKPLYFTQYSKITPSRSPILIPKSPGNRPEPFKNPNSAQMETDQSEPQTESQDLFKAAETGESSAFESLTPKQLALASALRNEDGRSLLHVAVSSGQSQVPPTSFCSCSIRYSLLQSSLIFVYFFLCDSGGEDSTSW